MVDPVTASVVIVDTVNVTAPPPAVLLIELVWLVEIEVLVLSHVAVDTTRVTRACSSARIDYSSCTCNSFIRRSRCGGSTAQ